MHPHNSRGSIGVVAVAVHGIGHGFGRSLIGLAHSGTGVGRLLTHGLLTGMACGFHLPCLLTKFFVLLLVSVSTAIRGWTLLPVDGLVVPEPVLPSLFACGSCLSADILRTNGNDAEAECWNQKDLHRPDTVTSAGPALSMA